MTFANLTGCPKKVTIRMLLEPWCTGLITSGRHPLGLENYIWLFFNLHDQTLIFMVKFSPTTLNFDYDFVLSVHFLGHPVCIHKHKNANTPGYIQSSVPPNWNKAQLRRMLQFVRNFAHLCEMLLKYEQYFVQSINISCNWARSFSGLTSVNKTEPFGVLKS